MEIENRENTLNGIIGAAGGALIGGALCFLMLQLNIISSVPAALASYCSLGGYELLGKKLSKKGIAIACIFSFAVLILAWLLDLSFLLAEAWDYEYSGFEIFPYIITFISEGYFTESIYLDLMWLILFGALGIFGKIKTAVQENDSGLKLAKKPAKDKKNAEFYSMNNAQNFDDQSFVKSYKGETDSKKITSDQDIPITKKKSKKIDELEKNLFQ